MADEILTKKQQKRRDTTDALAKLVHDRFLAAASNRQANGVTDLLMVCQRASLSQPLTGQHADPDFPVVYDITTPITRGIVAILNDTLTAAASDLFTLEPTESPTLTQDAEDRIIAQLEETQMTMYTLGIQPADSELQMQARMLMEAAKVAGNEQARHAANTLKSEIKDLLQENGFDPAIREGIHDFVHSLAMVIKAPSGRLKKTKHWEAGRLVFRDEIVRGVERIDPINFYLAPNARCPQTADYVVELRDVSPNELAALATQVGYDANEIKRAFDLYPEGHRLMDVDGVSQFLREPDQNTEVVTTNVKPYSYQVECMYGRVRGGLLKEMGIEGVEDHLHYDAEVFTIGTTTIRAVLNPDPAGRRPFFMASYDPVSSSPWGRCPVSHLVPLQRAATSTFVALLADLALSGIHIEVESARLHQDDRLDKSAVRPRVARVVKAAPNGTSKRVFDIFHVTPNTPTYRAEIDRLEARAYEVVGIQRFAIGETTGVGTVGRTAGGLASLLNQAAKGIKQVMRNIENHVVAPVVQTFVDYELQWGDLAAEFHGDVKVRAKGMTAVAEQAGQAEDLQWAMQSLTAIADKVDPTTGQPFIPAAAFPRLVYQMFKAKGIPTAGVFPADFEARAALEGQSAGGLPQGDVPGLDGRSQTSINSIQQSNDIMGVGAGA